MIKEGTTKAVTAMNMQKQINLMMNLNVPMN